MVKNLPANARDLRQESAVPGQEDPLEEGTATTPVFSPEEPQGQKNLMGYSP